VSVLCENNPTGARLRVFIAVINRLHERGISGFVRDHVSGFGTDPAGAAGIR